MDLSQNGIAGLVVLAIAIAVGIFFFVKARKKKEYYKTPGEIDNKPPLFPRTGLKSGYYITDSTQLAETIDHITVHWTAFREGLENMIRDFKLCKERGIPVVVDVADLILQPRRLTNGVGTLYPNAVERLTEYFATLKSHDILDVIKYLTPTDEPNLPDNNVVAALPDCVRVIKEAMAGFHELDNTKLLCVYFYEKPFPNVDLFDVVGVNNYHVRSKILAPGQQYDKLKAMLRPGQTTILFPGAYIGQSPEQFFNFALDPANSEVEMVSVFLWSDNIDGSRFDGLRVRAGIDKDMLQERYIEQMLKVKSLQ